MHLQDLTPQQLHCKILIGNRARMVEHFLPETAKQLGPRFSKMFAVYAEDCWPPPHAHLFTDALLFVKWLKKTKIALNLKAIDRNEVRQLRWLAVKAFLRTYYRPRPLELAPKDSTGAAGAVGSGGI